MFLSLDYEPTLESLGYDYFDEVAAAEFPRHILRFRNDQLLPVLGLEFQKVTDADFIQAFGKFVGIRPFLALRYHGYQFGEYNSRLGDGRGFLYGQVRGRDRELYDFGTKGSGTTPYSRGADGRLTLKGGVREVLAAEALHSLGVRTSRCLSLIETGEPLWRGDEPSPTRSSVMVRLSRSHIRFGTFERLYYFKRRDLIEKLLDHVIEQYYSHVIPVSKGEKTEQYVQFYAELVERVAELAAQWMAAGFCHGVLNTDNMSITGESFDYGPYAFIPTYSSLFTAAYFDYYGRYSYGRQPAICKGNLEMLQQPLGMIIPVAEMEEGLRRFDTHYSTAYRQLMLNKLGFESVSEPEADELLNLTIEFLKETQVGYHEFFAQLAQQFNPRWRDSEEHIFSDTSFLESGEQPSLLANWRSLYHHVLQNLSTYELEAVGKRLRDKNPKTALLRPVIEDVWGIIDRDDNWEPFYDLVRRLQAKE
ncbi:MULTISPECIES: protein adenylyltransferase SelO [unclassified Coleofasciculus]|uniref:protein adenylyltransferase SelO n=1 Tax=unclassified Coleofasciculus TaxID=2692782 RepID=UPI001881A8B2|nr:MULTISPECIES: YdiU family protein [unclassified Coleofasciculus]MBE9124608.1 YdiU family protein [Coleofasciculus sp. LEGE 07081]MBE9147572.1 YdiU family protein [Coleofasciculus sp. LEGE 07092]